MGTSTSWCYQIMLLLRRNFINQIRIPSTSYIRLLVVLCVSTMTIILYYDLGEDLESV